MEKATLTRDQIQRLGVFMSDLEESSKREFFACKSSSFSLLLQFTSFTVVFYFWGGESSESVAFD